MRKAAQPWDQMAGESVKAFKCFLEFKGLIPENRSILEAYRRRVGRPGAQSIPGYVSDWSAKFQWVARVKAWDQEQIRLRLEEEERAFSAERKLWALRKASQARQTWERADSLTKLAERIQSLPLVETVVEESITAYDRNGNEITIPTKIVHKPIRANVRDAIKATAEADRLQRLSTGSATELVLHDTPEAQRQRQIEKARQALHDWMRESPEDDVVLVVRECAMAFDLEPELFYDPREFTTEPVEN